MSASTVNFNELDFNAEFIAAFEALENSAQALFITGKAGTGKSTLLQYFRYKTQKKIAVLAPTGVAAINIKGQTIHSFFQFKPDITPESVADIPIRKKKQKMYAQLQALIIDEISMVRADLLDCIDALLRIYGPEYGKPFGGVQMIFFGDLYQLPPVVSRGEEDIFKNHYPTPYFFSAKSFVGLDLRIMQLEKIYRQKDEGFIHLLNAVRDNQLQSHHLAAFNTRFLKDHKIAKDDFRITLTTTNALADKVNVEHLGNLPGNSVLYHGIISGEFDRRSLPALESLELKVGAQVMMLNNDQEKRWVNGSLGKVIAIRQEKGDDIILVQLENGLEVDVKKHTWEIYQYYFDEAIEQLASKVIGYFTQYPFKLAWAVTIHKSQGQTFERVMIDLGWGTFSHGQVYVALSRCTSLDGIILKQPLSQRHILMDERVNQFMLSMCRCIFVAVLFFTGNLFAAVAPETKRSELIDEALAQAEAPVKAPEEIPAETPSETTKEIKQDVEIKQVKEIKGQSDNSQLKKAKGEAKAGWLQEHEDKPYIGLVSEYDTVINNDWSSIEKYHARVKIQKESAKELGEWPIYYNKAREEILEIKALVEAPDGKKHEAKQIQDLQVYDDAPMYSDMRVKVISLPQVNIGSVIDVHVKVKTLRKEIPGQYWNEITYPVIPTKYARHTYTIAEDMPMAFHAYNNDYEPSIEKKNGKIVYSFVFEETDYVEDEEFMPPVDEVMGVLSLSSMKDWKQVADWYRVLIDKNTVEDAEISVKAIELTKDYTDLKDKARAILEFIQDNFRYVSMSLGDHSVEPHPTKDVFANRYGDCKDLSLLARQMLKLAGIDADICLFSGEFNGNPQHRLPNLSSFDHVILEINIEGKDYFVDPQTKGFDLGQLPSSYDNAHVLVIDPVGFRFDNLPIEDDANRSVVSNNDIFVLRDGSAIFEAKVKLPLEASQSFKQTWESTTDDNKDKFFEGLEANFAQGGRMIDRQVKGLQERYGSVEFTLKYESPTAYPLVNDMILLKEINQGDVPDFAAAKRVFPLFMPSFSMVKNINTYHLPEGFKVDFVPDSYDLKTPMMEVAAKYTKEEDKVIVESVYRMKRANLPASDYPQIKDFRNELYKKNDQYIILKGKSKVSEEAKEWIKTQ